MTDMFGLLELPFLFTTVCFAFLVARALRGGTFGFGMTLMAWGFLLMGLGHLNMQATRQLGVNAFHSLFGQAFGDVVWFVALIATWGLSGIGFYLIYSASRSK